MRVYVDKFIFNSEIIANIFLVNMIFNEDSVWITATIRIVSTFVRLKTFDFITLKNFKNYSAI